jgi:hypothetical protein
MTVYRLSVPMGQFHSSGRMLYWSDEAGRCIGLRWLLTKERTE